MLAAAVAVALVFALAGGEHERYVGKFAGGDPDQQQVGAKGDTPGEGPANGLDNYLAAAQAYPANLVPLSLAKREATTFNQLAGKTAKDGDPKALGHKWTQYGPKQDAVQPGVLAFSGATNSTASRTTVLVVSPSCGANADGGCRIWAGAAGGGIWRTDDGLAANPDWKQVNPANFAQNSIGTLTLDPSDPSGNTLYLGTGEANRCTSGCEAGVGLYKSTDGGNHWTKLAGACVDNATYACVNHGDAFLGRAIDKIVIDPTNPSHIFVGSALAVRGLSHVIGSNSTSRFEPGANEPGLYESTDGGATFTEVWNGAKPDTINGAPGSFGITDVGLDPSDPSVVYASAFDAGLYRRDHGSAQTAFTQVFKPQFNQGAGIDRTMFALTTKNGHTRIYLTEGTQGATASNSDARAANFWRTDMGDQASATLLASQPAACTAPDPATHTFPTSFTGWQCLTSKTLGNPYFASDNFCTQQCWYDQDVFTPAGMPDTVYLIGSNLYSEQPCDTNGVGCGNGVSDGREVLYSTTAGDPDGSTTGPAAMRTFTDLSYDATIDHPPWCALAAVGIDCLNAPNGIHPDQHAIAVNPSDPTQIFEGSDGGVIRTSGDFADISSQCDGPQRDGGGPLPADGNTTCKQLLSRVPTVLSHIDKKLSSTLQFVNVAIDPFNPNEILGGTQDNGTWSNLGNGTNTFTQVNYGDGGNAAFDPTHPGWMANEFTQAFADASFENGKQGLWVFTTTPVVRSLEAIGFYWPQISDPNPLAGTHPIYEGAQHVWRSWAFGAGTPHQVPQDTTPNISDYEANCLDLFTSGIDPRCGDFQPLGGPYCESPVFTPQGQTPPFPACSNQPGDLTGTAYGTDRTGGSISWLARSSSDHSTMWAATSAGRVFVTHNVDASDPANVTWLRIDNSLAGASPTRFPSGIWVDPSNSDHAWISYSGYNAVTPTTPGHVFSVTNTGVTGGGAWTNLNVEEGTSGFPTPTGDGDLPISDIVRDNSTHTLYVSSDFGVLRGDDDGTGGWHVTAGMPRYEVMHLAIEPSTREPTCAAGKKCPHLLYAATHSQGIWRMNLGKK